MSIFLLREVKGLSQGCKAGNRQNQNLNSGSVAPDPRLLRATLYSVSAEAELGLIGSTVEGRASATERMYLSRKPSVLRYS